MKSVVAVAAAAAAAAQGPSQSELLCVLFQIMELRNARLEGNETAFVRVQIDKVAQVKTAFFFESWFEQGNGALAVSHCAVWCSRCSCRCRRRSVPECVPF